MKKLPARFKTKFVNALLSGKFKQGPESLHDSVNDTYCCLGVAGICAGAKPFDLEDHSFPSGMDQDKEELLPDALRGDDSNPIVDKLAKFNDGGKSFKWIAAYIKRYL